ncbi:MAG: hypothetical protein ACPG1A_02710 [Halioglobus sp.]
MTRHLISLTLALTCSTAGTALAANWPWEEAPEDDLEYCKGLVVGGLDSRAVGEADRTELWLAWSYLIRAGAVHVEQGDAFQSGVDQFATTLDVATIQSNLDQADGSCGIGRSGRQITGW